MNKWISRLPQYNHSNSLFLFKTSFMCLRRQYNGKSLLSINAITILLFCINSLWPLYVYSQELHNLPIALVPNKQSQTELIADGEDGAYIIWLDNREGTGMIYCQYLNELGHPQWQENGMPVISTPGKHISFSAVSDSAGGLIIVWHDAKDDAGDIYAQRLNRGGVRIWGESGAIVFKGNQKQSFPRAVSDGANGVIVAWQDERSNILDVFTQRLDAAGQRLWIEEGLAVAQEKRIRILGNAQAIQKGGIVIAWIDKRTNPDQINIQHMNHLGNRMWEKGLSVGVAKDDQSDPVLLVSYVNNEPFIYTAWLEERFRKPQILIQRVSLTDGILWHRDGLAVSSTREKQERIRLLSNDDAGVFVIWEEERNKRDIFAQQIDDLGNILWGKDGLPVIDQNRDQENPRVVSDGEGGFLCVWWDERGGGSNILGQHVNAEGNLLWETGGSILTNHNEDVSSPVILQKSNGRSLVAWEDRRHDKGDIYAQPLTAEGHFENVPPKITSLPVLDVHVDSLYEYKIESIDFDSDVFPKLVLASGPLWLSVNQNNRTIFGKPGINDVGEQLVVIQAVDADSGFDSQSYTLRVLPNPHTLKIVSSPDTVAFEDQRYQYKIIVQNAVTLLNLNYSLETTAQWLAVDSASGIISGTPGNDDVGDDLVVIKITDFLGEAIQRYTLHVENVNDLPFFLSTPDTSTFVDSLYTYQISTADIDFADSVRIDFPVLPAWLHWDALTQTLSGIPKPADAKPNQISIRASDLNGGSALQQFTLVVFDQNIPDNTPPNSPINLILLPDSWTTDSQFEIQWQNPVDPSTIAGVYYKIGSVPTSDQDGVYVAGQVPNVINNIIIQAEGEGRVPVYIWLVDGRNNIDYTTALSVDYRYDVTAPGSPVNFQIDNAIYSKWLNSEMISLSWSPMPTAKNDIAGYELFIGQQSVARFNGDMTETVFDTLLLEGTYFLRLTAIDSAGNLSTAAETNVCFDFTKPALEHVPVDTIQRQQRNRLAVQARDALAGISNVRLFFRTTGQSQFNVVDLTLNNNEYSIVLDNRQVESPGFEYFINAEDSAGNETFSLAKVNSGQPYTAVVYSQAVTSPLRTSNSYYQLISLPYHPEQHSFDVLLTDNFGPYNPTVWRLYAYDQQHGNIELGEDDFLNLEVGRGYWLATSEPQSYDFGPVYSISATEDFVFTLQPGWNVIASPYTFSVDWQTVTIPADVEQQLWKYDGQKYVVVPAVFEPWQGYFIRNLSSEVRTITIPPVCFACSDSLIAKNINHDAHLLKLQPPNSDDNKLQENIKTLSASWHVQLRLTDGEFSDDENSIGVSTIARDEWDALDLSEPPFAAGNSVSLRFDRKHWSEYGGYFTRDFRPLTNEIHRWTFETLASLQGQRLEIDFMPDGKIPQDWQFLLEDESGQIKELNLKSSDKKPETYTFRSSKDPNKFVLTAGPKDKLTDLGVLADVSPKSFSLLPSYPNPAAISRHSNAVSVIRFNLPEEVDIVLNIYDILGRKVRSLLQWENFSSGHHQILWDGKDELGIPVSAGIYIYRFSTKEFSKSQKIILIR